MSLGSPILPTGCIFSLAFKLIGLSTILFANGVFVKLGAIALNLSPFLAYVLEADRTIASIPALEATIIS